jgi:cytochrome c oxidase cbb3-type subunit II
MSSHETPVGHARIETNNFLMIVLITLVVAVGGLVEIVPLFFQKSTTQPIEGLKPYTALQLAGRDVYVSEGCYNCHSQMIRPFQAETLRYGPYSVAGEFVYDRPFQWGSKRTGPDLHRVGGRYSDEWHRIHLNNPRDLVPESNMPAYPFLSEKTVDADSMPKRMQVLRTLGAPYSDEEIAKSVEETKGKTQLEAVVAYLQVLGTARTAAPTAAAPTPVVATAAAEAAPAAPAAPAPTGDDARVVVESGMVKFYFASGKAELAQGGAEALADAAKAAKEGKKLMVSGFHDSTGDLASNQELAKTRAFAVRDALVAQGVDAAQVELVKPAATEGGGASPEARRVEVSIK